MRQAGASGVAVVVLIVVIVAAIAFLIIWATRSGPPDIEVDVTEEGFADVPVKCQLCGWEGAWSRDNMAEIPADPQGLYFQCPKCKKFSVQEFMPGMEEMMGGQPAP